jgi:hypothetical protein
VKQTSIVLLHAWSTAPRGLTRVEDNTKFQFINYNTAKNFRLMCSIILCFLSLPISENMLSNLQYFFQLILFREINSYKKKYFTIHQTRQEQQWNLQLRETLTQEAQQQFNTLTTLLMNIQQETQEQDRLSWRWHISGQYTVRSCYRALQEGPHIVSPLTKI